MTRNRHGFNGAPRKKEEIVISEGVTPEWIEPFYAGYDVDKHKARCAACNKPELFDGDGDEEFLACSGCHGTVYCSRECQKAHWKDHKTFCQMHSCDEDAKFFKTTLRKLKKFQGLYYPLIELMIHLRFALLSKELNVDLDSIPSTHIVYMHLADIPADNKDAKRPRICISGLEPKTISDLEEDSRNKILKTRDRLKDQGHVVSYTFVYPCFEVGKCYKSSQYCLHSRDPFYYFRRYDKLEILQKVTWLIQGINGMAKGQRPDIYTIVKKFMKEDGGRYLKGEEGGDNKNASGTAGKSSNKNKKKKKNRK